MFGFGPRINSFRPSFGFRPSFSPINNLWGSAKSLIGLNGYNYGNVASAAPRLQLERRLAVAGMQENMFNSASSTHALSPKLGGLRSLLQSNQLFRLNMQMPILDAALENARIMAKAHTQRLQSMLSLASRVAMSGFESTAPAKSVPAH